MRFPERGLSELQESYLEEKTIGQLHKEDTEQRETRAENQPLRRAKKKGQGLSWGFVNLSQKGFKRRNRISRSRARKHRKKLFGKVRKKFGERRQGGLSLRN